MKKSEYDKITERYLNRRKRLESINIGELVWEVVFRGGLEEDYHPAIVKSVNVDEDYVNVVDISDNNKEKEYKSFFTESDLLGIGFSKENIAREHEKYKSVIEEIKRKFGGVEKIVSITEEGPDGMCW